MMSGLRLNNHPLERPREQQPALAVRPPRNIIEISDDDLDYLPRALKPPARGRRPGTPMSRNRRKDAVPSETVALSDSDESSELTPSSFRRDRPLKRAKLEHAVSVVGEPRATAVPKAGNVVLPLVRNTRADGSITLSDDEHEQNPSYYDAKFDCLMYRGPGFERFPVAIGTIDGHKEMCAEWDRRNEAKHQNAQNPKASSSKSSKEQCEQRVLTATLEILPDIAHDFVRQQVGLVAQQNPGITHEMLSAEVVINHIFELKDYPKEPKKEKKHGPEPAADGTGVTVPVNKDMQNPALYSKEPVILLAFQFPHIPTCSIFKVFHDKGTIYDSYLKLTEMEETYFDITKWERPYRRMKQARQSIEKKYEKRAHEHRNFEAYGHWVNEIQAAKQHLEREAIKNNTKAKEEAKEARNLELHRQNGSLVECGVCFDDEIPMNRATTCQGEDAHFFCFSCVNQLADTQIGMMKYEMQCMDGSGCKASLDPEGVGKAVPIKTVDRLALNQQQAEIAAAGIEGLEQCPYCEFKAILDPIETVVVFQCLNPDCGRHSCRKCKEEAHVPKTCEEFKKDRGLSARHMVEEARSDSVMRTCPKCKVKIIKEHGCNKMACTQCACIMCYLCKVDITKAGYDHFHKSGSKCQLYDQNTAGLHEAEADAAELEAIKQARAQDGDLDEKALQIETGKKKKKLPAAPRQDPIRAAHAIMPPDRQHMRDPLQDLLAPNGGRRLIQQLANAHRQRDIAELEAVQRFQAHQRERDAARGVLRPVAGGPGAVGPGAPLHQVGEPYVPEAFRFLNDQQAEQDPFQPLRPNEYPEPDFNQPQFDPFNFEDFQFYDAPAENDFARWEQELNVMMRQPPPQPVPQQQGVPARYPAPQQQQQPLNAANLNQFNNQIAANAVQNAVQHQNQNGGNWGRLYGWFN